ncbi:hypothetical protein GGF42_002468 [Coemansia sp. RSA 2424]|nr:hypothetical protein GGF42_002468 [Coemansia sp. RSA 2424]
MKGLLIFGVLAAASLGLPGMLDIGKLLGGGGLLDGVEKLLTNKDAPPRASAADSPQSLDTDSVRDRGESSSQPMSLAAHSPTIAGVILNSANNPRSASSNNDAAGQKSQIDAATKQPQSPGQDNSQQSEATAAGLSEDMDEDENKAGADESSVITSSDVPHSSGTPRTVVHTQFIVVAPGVRSTLLMQEPEHFSAMDNSAYAASLSSLRMTLLLPPLVLFCNGF